MYSLSHKSCTVSTGIWNNIVLCLLEMNETAHKIYIQSFSNMRELYCSFMSIYLCYVVHKLCDKENI